MIHISTQQINEHCSYPGLIGALREAFKKKHNIPKRHHHQYPNPKEGVESTLLLMPAWDDGDNVGVKIINVSPNNSSYNLPTIHGNYLLYDQHKGIPKAIFDAKMLTNKRTAAASALASSILSRADASCLMMIGTGALAPELIKAHTSVRPIKKVYVWGRSFGKAQKVCAQLENQNFEIIAVENYLTVIDQADIISSATLSTKPLIYGRDIKPGQHIDLVGSFKPDMRESDDELISKVKLYVDNYVGATTESGDLVIPLKKGILSIEDIKADLFELCLEKQEGRKNDEEITCFKSVGHALEDLVAATLVFNEITKGKSK